MDALLFLSFPSRLTGVFAAPGAVGRSLASQPRWLGALLVCLILSVTSAAAVYLHPTGKKLILEEVRKNASPAGTKEGASFFEEHYKTAAAFGIGGAVVGTTLVLLLSATLLWLTFTIIMGAALRFPHHLSIAAHGWIVLQIGGLLAVALMLLRGSMHSTLSLAAFAPRLPTPSILYQGLALFDFLAWFKCG